MLNELKRLAMMGIGAVSMAEDEIRATIDELRKKEALSEEEGKRILTEWRERVETNRREVQEFVGKAVEDALKPLDTPTREDFNALVSRVEALEGKLDQERA